MRSQNDRGLLYDIEGGIIIIVSFLLLVQSLYLLLLLWAAYTRLPLVFGFPGHDESHNV